VTQGLSGRRRACQEQAGLQCALGVQADGTKDILPPREGFEAKTQFAPCSTKGSFKRDGSTGPANKIADRGIFRGSRHDAGAAGFYASLTPDVARVSDDRK
jgi:hypothetical protein